MRLFNGCLPSREELGQYGAKKQICFHCHSPFERRRGWLASGVVPRSGNQNPASYLAVAFPISPSAREEWIVRRRLHIAPDVNGPRSNAMLTRWSSAPIKTPEPPSVGVYASIFVAPSVGISV